MNLFSSIHAVFLLFKNPSTKFWVPFFFMKPKSARIRIIVTIFLVSTFMSCTKTQDEQDWLQHRIQWERVRSSNYTFTLKTICFCPIDRVGPHVIEVKNLKIVTVNGKPYDPSITGPIMTIDELFVFIKTSLDRKPAQSNIQYSADKGYPEQLYFDFDRMMADEEIGYQISDVTFQ